MTEQTMPYRHKLSFRYAVTLGTNVLRISIAGITGLVTARALGPDGYGTVNFLLATFSSLVTLLALGSADAFYTFISAGRRGPLLFKAFFGFILFPLLALTLLTIAAPASLTSKIWRGQPAAMLALGLAAAYLMYLLWNITQQIGESARETLFVQKIRLGIVIANFAAIGAFAAAHMLTAKLFLLTVVLSHTAAIIWFFLKFPWQLAIDPSRRETLPELTREFAVYCSPLIAMTTVNAATAFFDKWALQTFGGAAEQGYFSVGEQLAVVMLVGVYSLSNIFWKEIAHANATGDHARLRQLYEKSVKSVYFATCFIAYFIMAFCGEAITALLGPKYHSASVCTALIIFTTTLQSVVQLNYAYLMATHKTRANMLITIPCALAGSILTYLFIAGPTPFVPGLGMGAAGLALKAVIFQIIFTNIQILYICRSNGWRFSYGFQIRYAAMLLFLALCSHALTAFIPATHLWLALRLTAAAALYTAAGAWYAVSIADELGVSRDKLRTLYADIRHFAGFKEAS